MAKALMLWPAGSAVRIGPTEAASLARLGVTTVTLLRDAETVAIVLDGWAFSPKRSARAAASALGDSTGCRVLETALDVAVADATTIGGLDEPTIAPAAGQPGRGEPAGC
jgi:hypothetical protein